MKKRINAMVATIVFLGLFAPVIYAQGKVSSPEEYFGFRMGSDKKIARWDKIVEYFRLMEKQSPRIKVIELGPSTMGHPFLLVIITSAENMTRLERFQKINAAISDPRDIPESEINDLIKEGKAVICQSMSLHATEIGGTQMAPELAYDLLSGNDEETRRILDNVIFCMIPSFNPDGQIMVTDWYKENLGTEYEGAGLPWLYHKYVGHDNNRDGDFLNMVESKYAAKIMYRDWIPQAYMDHHHMGSYGARFYIPPYCDPIRPHADPLIWRELSWYGAHIAYKLEEKGKSGILNAAQFPGWGHFGWHWITPFHNIAGMLTESASAKIASPIYIHPDQLRGDERQFPEYEAQSTFPNPWPGGWWRLRDIVEQKKISAWALLDLAARNKDTVLRNAYLKAKNQTARGANGEVKAFVIPMDQHDPPTMLKMINTLLLSGIEIKRAKRAFSIGYMTYPKETFLISTAQPKMGLIMNLLGRTLYPDNNWTRAADGSPLEPYDLATHNMNEFMGVTVVPVTTPIEGDFAILPDKVDLIGKIEAAGSGYILDGRINDSYSAVNMLLDKGVVVRRLDKNSGGHRPGDFIVSAADQELIKNVAASTGVDFISLQGSLARESHPLKRLRVGMYQRYYGGNIDEGWTRFVLEQFHFPYDSLKDAEIQKGALKKKVDVIVFPHDREEMITGKISESSRRTLSSIPPKYRSGIGDKGVAALKEFVESGGVLVALGEATQFAISSFGLKVENVVAKKTSNEFFCPGSTLQASFDNHHPLAYGMPSEGLLLFGDSAAFRIIPGPHNERVETVVRFRDRELLRSGWLIGEKYLSKKAAMVAVQYKKGRIILIGFRPQHRSQTHGTFKLLFNALLE